MRKLRRKIKKTYNKFLALAVVSIVFMTYVTLYKISGDALYTLAGLGAIGIFFFLLPKSFEQKTTYINEKGYVVLTKENELQHRYIAKQILDRKLAPNEIVHHINGIKTDNEVKNLCLMDSERHEHFHSWLSWKRKKSGRYPSFPDQKRVLVTEYGGILLENFNSKESKTINTQKPKLFTHPPRKPRVEVKRNSFGISMNLFNELRKERKKIADSKNLPAYLIFKDYTLHEMVERLPDTHQLMSQIIGVNPEKLNNYGDNFISIIKRYKIDNRPSTNHKGSA